MAQTWSNGGFVTFAIGVGVGVIGALLLAPKSGEDLRDDIVQRATDGATQVKRTAKRVSQRAQNVVLDANDRVADAVSAGQDAYNTALYNNTKNA